MPLFDHRVFSLTPHMQWVLGAIRPQHPPIRAILSFDYETFLIQPGNTAPKLVCGSGLLRRPMTTDEPFLCHANFDREALCTYMRAALLDPSVLFVGANISFDLAVTANEWPELLEPIFQALDQDRVACVELTQRLIDNATNQLGGYALPDGTWFPHRYNLAALVKRHLGVDMDKDTWRLRYGTLWDVPVERWEQGAIDYSIGDSVGAYGVFQSALDPYSLRTTDTALRSILSLWQQERVGPELTLIDLFRQTRAQFWLALMVARGFRVDPIMVRALKALLEQERDRLLVGLRQAGLVGIDGKKNLKAAAERMKQACAFQNKKPKMTSGGEKGVPQIALDEEACIESLDSVLADFAAYTSIVTMLSKDIGALEEPAERGLPIQSRFETMLETGRTSCSGGGKEKAGTYGYQLQNPRRLLDLHNAQIQQGKKLVELFKDPTHKAHAAAHVEQLKKLDAQIDKQIGVRQCFVPRPGYVLSSNDFAMFEACTWCQASIDLDARIDKMIDALNNGRDVHLELAAAWLGTDYADVFARRKEPAVKEARQRVKPGTFGFMGGMGANTFVVYAKNNYQVVFTLEEAKKIKRAWTDTWQPGAYFDCIAKIVQNGDQGEVVQVRSHRRRAWCSYTETSNSFFQGLAADCAKDAGYEITREMFLGVDRRGRRSPLEGSRIVDFVHDEFISEHPLDLAHEAAHRVAELMREAGRRWCPDVPPDVQPALMMRWYKGAEARHDENGRLVPWEPGA